MTEAGKQRFIYLCVDGGSTVVESQVIDHLRLLHETGGALNCDLFLFRRAPLAHPSLFDKSRKKEIEEAIGGKLVGHVFAHPLTGFFAMLWLLFRHTFPRCFSERLVVIGRAKDGALTGSIFKWLCLGRPKIVFDMRGDLEAEARYAACASGNKFWTWLCGRTALAIEWFALRGAHRVLYVSEAMRRTIEQRRPFARDRYGGVFPCLGDSSKFYFDPSLRETKRSELSLAPEDKLLAYIGYMQPYQRFGDVARLYALCKSKDPKVRLLAVTPEENHSTAKAELEKASASDGAIVLAAPHEKICGLLNAADAGVLLREPSPINAAAWPVKFAEYLLCGLPVALSDGIGDCSELVEQHNLGIVVESLDDLESAATNLLRMLAERESPDSRREAGKLAKRLFARETRIGAYAEFVRSVR